MSRNNLIRYFFESYDYQTFGALYAVSIAIAKGLHPETIENISAILRTPKARVTSTLMHIIVAEREKLQEIADEIIETAKKRSHAANKRWANEVKTQKLTSVTKIKKLAIEILKGEDAAMFHGVWSNWPKRSDGKVSRGERPKAERCWEKIIKARLATATELAMCAKVYATHPNVIAGYVKNVTTFYAIADGLWREALVGARTEIKRNIKQS